MTRKHTRNYSHSASLHPTAACQADSVLWDSYQLGKHGLNYNVGKYLSFSL